MFSFSELIHKYGDLHFNPRKNKDNFKSLANGASNASQLSIVIMFSLPQYEKTRNILMIVFFCKLQKQT